MSAAVLSDGPPEAKKFRIDVPATVDVESSLSPPSESSDSSLSSLPSRPLLEGHPLQGEAPLEGQSPAGPSSARSSNGSVISNESAEKEDDNDVGMTGNLLEMISRSLLGNVLGKLDDGSSRPLPRSLSPSPAPQVSTLPGAVAVAQSPAAQLFAEDDWSWHRNPAAAIRSGGTNKQTPVWKYFVYNKAENVSRCIIGDCTYMLKGPHTSTLACHLKKHPNEYSEFQKLKVDYTRDRHGGQLPPSPSSSSSVTSMSTPRPPKIKKEQQRHDMTSLVNAMRSAQSPQAPSPMPNLVQNLLGMNPLQFMMNHQNHQQPPPVAPAMNVNGMNAAHAASQMLQQAGLTVSASGQIMQSKKWRRDERRQRELESRLALALSASHVPLDSLHCPLWRDLFEAAQPKFSFPDDISQMEQMAQSHHSRLVQSLKSHLSSARRICIVVEAVRVPSPHQEDPITRIAVSASFPGYSGQKYETQHSLLAFRPLAAAESPAEAVTLTVEQVLSEFDISMDKVSKVICSRLQAAVEDEDGSLFDRQMEPFSDRLLACFSYFIDNSSAVEDLRKAVFALIFAFVTKPDALQALNKATGGAVDLPLTEPFVVLAEAVLRIKEAVQMISEQTHTPCALSEHQWTLLRAVCCAAQLFRQAAGGDSSTVDGAIPALRQLINSVEKESLMSCIADELSSLIRERMSFALKVDADDFDGSYAQATALNPQMASMLGEELMAYAKGSLEKQLSSRLRSASSRSLGVDALLANVISQSKMNGNLELANNPLYADILQQAQERMQQLQERVPGRDRMAEAVISSYFDEVISGSSVEALLSPFGHGRPFGNPFQPPLLFWQQASNQCPQLAEIASELLSLPSCPPPMSRLLSLRPRDSIWSAVDGSLVLSHLDKADRLERDLLLRVNRSLIPKTY